MFCHDIGLNMRSLQMKNVLCKPNKQIHIWNGKAKYWVSKHGCSFTWITYIEVSKDNNFQGENMPKFLWDFITSCQIQGQHQVFIFKIKRAHLCNQNYRKTSSISRTLEGNKIVDNSDVVGASPAGAAPTTSSLSTEHLALIGWAKTTARGYKKHLSFGIWCDFY